MENQMIRVGTFISILIFSSEVAPTLLAQNSDSLEYYEIVDILPTFRGTADYNEFLKYFASELKYPTEAIRDSFEGRVIAYYVVDSMGSVIDPFFIDSIPQYIQTEIERVLLSSPKWTPGIYKGKPVNTLQSIPVTFSLNSDEEREMPKAQQTKRKKRKTTANTRFTPCAMTYFLHPYPHDNFPGSWRSKKVRHWHVGANPYR